MAHLSAEKLSSGAGSTYSLHSLAEGSQAISEAEEIHEVQNLQQKGDRAFERDNYSDALRFYNEALEIDENSQEVLAARTAVYLKIGNAILAQHDVEKLLMIQPNHPQGHYLLGVALENQGQYRDSLFAFLKAMELDVNSGNATMLSDNIASLCVHFSHVPPELMEQLPTMEPYKKLCEVGACLYQSKRYELCLYVLGAAQKVATNQKGITMKVLLTMANAHSKLRQRDVAISIFQECLSAAVSVHDWQYQTKALVNIASLYLEANNTHQAVIYYEKLLDLQREMRGDSDEGPLPDYWSPELECSLYLNASIAYKAIGAIDRAVWHAEKYATLMKDKENRKHALAQSHQNVGMLQEILGKPLEALESYKLFLKASKEKGDDANIARAYGCLGSVYATLKNRQLSLTYHDQHVSLVRTLGDSKMLASALEQMGDTYMKMELPLEAVNSYMEMFQNIPRNDVHRQTTALCKLGSANKELGRFQYSLYYYEQAKMIADDFDFNDIKVFCEFNQACILQYSTQHYEMQQARTYFEKLIPLLEAKIHQHQEEATFCSQELHDQLTKCYDGMQLILKKLEQKEDCLVYGEASRKRLSSAICAVSSSPLSTLAKASGNIAGYAMWSAEKLNHVINQQAATVVFYSILHDAVLIWVLHPGEGIVGFHGNIINNHPGPIDETLRDLIREITADRDLADYKYSCENRSLPLKTVALDLVKRQNEALAWEDEDTTTDMTETESELTTTAGTSTGPTSDTSSGPSFMDLFGFINTEKEPGDKNLYDWLISPIEHVLAKFEDPEEPTPIVMIPDKSLHSCPFPYIRCPDDKLFGERFRVTCVPSLFMLEQVTVNHLNYVKRCNDLELARLDACRGGLPQFSGSNGNLSSKQGHYPMHRSYSSQVRNENVDAKKTSHPRLAKSGSYLSQKTPLRTLSRRPTFLSDKSMMSKELNSASFLRTVNPLKADQIRRSQNINTLTHRTSTDTDITKADCGTTPFKQVSKTDRAVVIGCPVLPTTVCLHGGSWRPRVDLPQCQIECHRIANLLEVQPILANHATKDTFLQQAKTATILHIATIGCHKEACLAFTPNPSVQKGTTQSNLYLVSSSDIASLSLVANLVIISGAWSTRQEESAHYGYQLATAFLTAGAQSVLMLLWAIPSEALEKFYFHLYRELKDGQHVSQAVNKASEKLRENNRYASTFCWSPFLLIGRDVTIDVTSLRHAMMDQTLDSVEADVAEQLPKDPLNPKTVIPPATTRSQYLHKLQDCMGRLVAQHGHQPDILADVIDMLDEALKRLHLDSNNKKVRLLDRKLSDSTSSLRLLKLLGYHFQPSGPQDTDPPYVIFPQSNLHDLLLPTYDALRALLDLIDNKACCHALCELFPTSQENISHLVDVMSISKHASEIQLKVSDISVRPLWQTPKVKAFLLSIGYHQIGLLLGFHNTLGNRKLLVASLQLLISMSCYKSPALIHKLDVSLLGGPHSSIQTSTASSAEVKLPSLTPLLMPGNQLRMHTPWLSMVEDLDEMSEKMKLAKSRSEINTSFHKSLERTKSWHQSTLSAQAGVVLEKIGDPKSRDKGDKMKVQPGASASCLRIPVDAIKKLSISEIAERRDYANYILQQRLDTVTKQHQQDIRKLYLPYVHN